MYETRTEDVRGTLIIPTEHAGNGGGIFTISVMMDVVNSLEVGGSALPGWSSRIITSVEHAGNGNGRGIFIKSDTMIGAGNSSLEVGGSAFSLLVLVLCSRTEDGWAISAEHAGDGDVDSFGVLGGSAIPLLVLVLVLVTSSNGLLGKKFCCRCFILLAAKKRE